MANKTEFKCLTCNFSSETSPRCTEPRIVKALENKNISDLCSPNNFRYYLPKPEPAETEIMPLITYEQEREWEASHKALAQSKGYDELNRMAQRSSDLAVLEAREKEWREKVEQARQEGYNESVKRAIDLAIFNVPYACKFGGIPERLLGIVIPEMNIVELRNPAPEVSDDKKDPRD